MSAQTQPVPSAAPQSQPSPQLFFDTINGFQKTAALRAAIDLDLFTAIAEGNHTSEAIALRCQTAQRGARILADYLTVVGFLSKSGDRYDLTPDSQAFLNRHSPAYAGAAIDFLLHPAHAGRWEDVAAAVRKGGTVSDNDGHLAPEAEIWTTFASAMGKLQTLPSEALAKLLHVDGASRLKVLDVAAGHGMFGIAVAKHNPHAEVVALDWANVLPVARRNAQEAGVAGRWRELPGSAFDVDYGTGYDLVLLTNVTQLFDVATCEQLLKKVHSALAPHGRAVIVTFVPDESRVTPPSAAIFPLTMLVTTPGGDAYTYSEYQRMLKNTGFVREELHDLPPSFFRVIIARK